MATNKILNPLTKRVGYPTVEKARKIAAALDEADVPIEWRRIISQYTKMFGYEFVFKDEAERKQAWLEEERKKTVPAWYKLWLEKDGVQVYHHFEPYSANSGERGTNCFIVIGDEEAVLEYIEQDMAEFHPAGYGTSYLKHSYLEDDRVVYRGTRATCCD